MTDQLILTKAQREQSLTALKEVDTLLSKLNQPRHRGLESAIVMLQSLPMASDEPVTDTFIQSVPDKCDRIVWRGNYYHLPLKATSPQPLQPITAEMVNEFENALDGGHGWWCDRDTKTILEVALNAVLNIGVKHELKNRIAS